METSELPIKHIRHKLEQICDDYGAGPVDYDKLLSLLCHNLGSVNLAESKTCQISTYPAHDLPELDNAPHNSGPLGAIQHLQAMSNRTPSQVLDSWHNLTREERHDIETPSSEWVKSVVKKRGEELSDLDIVSDTVKLA